LELFNIIGAFYLSHPLVFSKKTPELDMIKEYKYFEVIMSLLEHVDAATNLAKNNEV
jgi:hypothetical protein